MKRIITILIGLLLLGNAQAQQQAAASMTLAQCIEYALQNSISTQNALIDQQIAIAKVRETTGLGLPQIDGSVNLLYNNQLPRFFAQKGTAYAFSPASNPDGPGYVPYDQFLPQLKDDDVLASAPFFQLKGSGSASISINQLIFSGSYIVGLQAAKAYKELSVKNTNVTKEQLVVNVTKAFYSALINLERSKLFDTNIARVDSLLKNTKALNQNGFAESIDVDRIEVSLNNLVTERDRFLKLQELSLELLKFQMNYPMSQKLDVTGDITKEIVKVDFDHYLTDWNYKNRYDYQALETNRKLQALNLKNKYALSLPSISATANGGYSTQSNTVAGIFKTNSAISDEGGLGPDKWYKVSSIGLNVRVPIFSGLQRNYQVQQEKLALRKIENNFKVLESSIDLQVKQSTIMYQNAVSSLESQERNMQLASNVARVTRIKYEQGVGSNIEVVNAESSLKEAQVNYYNAMYDALVAKTDLDKAFGKIFSASTQNN